MLNISQTWAIKYGTGTTDHAGPNNGTPSVIKDNNIPLDIWSNKTTPKIINKIKNFFFISIFPVFWLKYINMLQ
jgi:hypothetical protein